MDLSIQIRPLRYREYMIELRRLMTLVKMRELEKFGHEERLYRWICLLWNRKPSDGLIKMHTIMQTIRFILYIYNIHIYC